MVKATLPVALAEPAVPVIGRDVVPVMVTFNEPDEEAAVVVLPR